MLVCVLAIPFILNMIPLSTLAAVVALDLLKGVGIGLAISIIFILQGNMKRAYYSAAKNSPKPTKSA